MYNAVLASASDVFDTLIKRSYLIYRAIYGDALWSSDCST